jgi:hypothetical protein
MWGVRIFCIEVLGEACPLRGRASRLRVPRFFVDYFFRVGGAKWGGLLRVRKAVLDCEHSSRER